MHTSQVIQRPLINIGRMNDKDYKLLYELDNKYVSRSIVLHFYDGRSIILSNIGSIDMEIDKLTYTSTLVELKGKKFTFNNVKKFVVNK